MRLLEGGIFNTEALKDSVRRINQLGYFKPVEKGEAISVDKTPGVDGKVDIKLKVEEQNRNSARVRRRRLAVRGVLRADVVPDGELPRPRRDRRRVAAEGRPGVQLSGLVQRAVPVRPSDQRGHRCSTPAPYIYPLAYTQKTTGSNATLGLPAAQLHARLPQLQLRGRAGQGHQPGNSPRPQVLGIEPVPARRAAAQSERAAEGQQDLAERRLQHGQPADLPDAGKRYTLVLRVCGIGARRQHRLHRHDARRHLVFPGHEPDVTRAACAEPVHPPVRRTRPRCPSSRSTSWAASTASADSTSGASARAIPCRGS